MTTFVYRDPAEILLGEGSYRYGGRWNAIGCFCAVYGSTDDAVALAESKANALYANLPYPFREPRLIVAAELSLSRVVDLTAAETLNALGVTEEELRCEDWRQLQEQASLKASHKRWMMHSQSRRVNRALGTRERRNDVVYFPENRASGSEVWVWEARKLRQNEV